MRRTFTTLGLLFAGFFAGALYLGIPKAHAGGPSAGGALLNGDANCNGTVDMSDAILMLNWLFLGGNRPCPLADPPHLVERVAELEVALAASQVELATALEERLSLSRELETSQAALERCVVAGKVNVIALDDCRRERDDGAALFGEIEAAVDVGCRTPADRERAFLALAGILGSERSGCTDPLAVNFDPCAAVDDGSCLALPIPDDFCSTGVNSESVLEEFRDDITGLEFVLLPGGWFQMGSSPDEPGHEGTEGPTHWVRVSPFLCSKFEITRQQWAAVMDEPLDPGWEGDLPVWVTFYDVQEFERRTGLSLPTEAQWEYACRAGTTGAFSGSGEIDEMGWYQGNSGGAWQPVGQKRPNQFGLFDVHGNAPEWCEDAFYQTFYDRADSLLWDPFLPSDLSGTHVVRGGHVREQAARCRSAARSGAEAEDHSGFRVVRPLRPYPPPPK